MRDENPPATVNNLSPASNLLQNNIAVSGLVENSGVSSRAVPVAAAGVSSAMNGMATVSRRDVISHIELTRERNSRRLCESLGNFLNSILHPPRTISDINSDFREASLNYENANNDSVKAYWQLAMDKLMDELRSV